MYRAKLIPAVLTVAVGLGVAFAVNGANHNGEQQEATAIQNAKISLMQAIAAAEKHTGGKAIDSGIENQNGKVIAYDIAVVKENAVQKVLVDMGTGQVIKVTAADSEHEDEGEHEND